MIWFFLAGWLQEFLVTINVRLIIRKKELMTSVISTVTTAIYMYVLYNIVQEAIGWLAILLYSLGVGLGAYMSMRVKLKHD